MTKISLKTARINKGMTQSEVAKALEVSSKTVSAWEKGKTSPRAIDFLNLCKLYDVNVCDIKI